MPNKKPKKNDKPTMVTVGVPDNFTCEHNPYAIVRMKNCEDPADTKIILAVHPTAMQDPIIMSEVIGSLLRFEKTHNKGEFIYNIVVEGYDKHGVSKDGKKNFSVSEVIDWSVCFLTSE